MSDRANARWQGFCTPVFANTHGGRMRLIGELRHRARYVVGPFLGICAAAYFTYHAIQGDRGLMAWARLSHDVEALRSEVEGLARHRAALEHRVKLLHPESLDPE